MTPSLGIEPGPHWWEASALTTAPFLHPATEYRFYIYFDFAYFCLVCASAAATMIFMKLTVSHKAICCGDLSPQRVAATYRLLCSGLKVVNLKNPELHLIRSILLECGYFGFIICFWISPKKRKIRHWIQESVFGFSKKKNAS